MQPSPCRMMTADVSTSVGLTTEQTEVTEASGTGAEPSVCHMRLLPLRMADLM